MESTSRDLIPYLNPPRRHALYLQLENQRVRFGRHDEIEVEMAELLSHGVLHDMEALARGGTEVALESGDCTTILTRSAGERNRERGEEKV
jgi:hypothetical protein